MSRLDFQVGVVGGGPSGARTAELLARRGISVVMFEAGGAGHEVLCSGLLNLEAQQALCTDLPDSIRMEPFKPLLEYCDADNRMRRKFNPGYINMSRPLFDDWLRELALEAGVDVMRSCRVRRIVPGSSGITLDTGQDQLKVGLVIDASGWRSMSRRLFKKPAAPQIHAFQGRVNLTDCPPVMKAIYISAVTPYYGWTVPKTGGEFLLGAGFPKGAESTREQHDDPWSKLAPFATALKEAGHSVATLDPKPFGHPITCISNMNQLWWGQAGVLPVGEAAGMVSPSSGDGISYCLQGADAVADVLAEVEFNSLAYDSDGLKAALHNDLSSRVRRRLQPALTELQFNITKAWVAARPAWRGAAAMFLPLFLRRRVQSLQYPA